MLNTYDFFPVAIFMAKLFIISFSFSCDHIAHIKKNIHESNCLCDERQETAGETRKNNFV